MAASRIDSTLGSDRAVKIVRTDPSPTHHTTAMLSSSVNTIFPSSGERDLGESDAERSPTAQMQAAEEGDAPDKEISISNRVFLVTKEISFCSRYFTASSGDEKCFDDDDDYNEDDDDDEDDGELCIMLDSDDDGDAGSLSGLHINLKTLQQVSNMLAHYKPIIQRDHKGNPVFVPPPPPDMDITPLVTPDKKTSSARAISSSSSEVADDLQIALQELENVINAEEDTFLVDKMSELTEVMEKMANCAAEEAENAS